jgi:DNA-binding response OmpR family regulator
MRVLVVEDHAKLAMTIATGLRRAGMAVDVAFDGRDALDHAALTTYDVIVLDRDIPEVHGDEVCKTLTAEGSTSRVLMLTAAGTVGDRVEGLGIGADDYLPKPCDFSELVARVRALARRPGTALPPALTYGTWNSTRRAASSPERAGRCRSTPRNSLPLRSFSPPRAWSCPPKCSSNASGTRWPTHSARPSERPSAGCGPSSGTRPS